MTTYTIMSGQTSNGLAIGVADSETVQSGGTSDGSVVTGGDVTILSGGVANDTMLVNFGLETVSSGGATFGTVIGNGGVEYLVGGAGSDASVMSGGTIDVEAGATETGATVASGARVNVLGGAAAGTTVGAGAFQNVYSGSASGTVVQSGGSEDVSGQGADTGSTIQGGGREVVGFGGSASLTDVAVGGIIDVTGLAYADGGAAMVDATDTLNVTVGGVGYSQTLSGDYTGVTFQFMQDSRSGTLIEFESTACYCRGTMILTDRGERAVETLQVGDVVGTASGRAAAIRWRGRRRYAGRFLAARPALRPIVISAGAFGPGLPRRDLRVSPEHAMFLDGALVPAGLLVNGSTIFEDAHCSEVEYHHVELSRHDLVLAEGVASETFLDDGGRGLFQTAAPNLSTAPAPGQYCAPRITGGAALQAIRRRLANPSERARRAA